MQTNIQNIQRPALFSDFFGKELLWNNEILTYINSGVKNVTSTLHKIVKTSMNNIKKPLKINKRIENINSQTFQEFSDKWKTLIYEAQDRRLGRI
jgi:hypothetical protein